MYRVIILCALASVTPAAVIPEDAQATIVKYENTNDGHGNYKFSYETSNGITREEVGNLVNVGEENEHMVVIGSYSYTDVDGKRVVVRYTADENGYQVHPMELGITLNVPPAPNDDVLPEEPDKQIVSSLPPAAVATLLGK